jgi:hypothetical protein
MSETGHPSEPVPEPPEADVTEERPKPTLGDYLTIANPRNLIEMASEILDQAANPYGTRRRRRKKHTD